MDRDTIIRLAREAGAVFSADGSWHKFEVEGSLERFAALVIANNPPQSWMSYQEGYEAGEQAGQLAEREECAKVCDEEANDLSCGEDWNDCGRYLARTIRSRTCPQQ